MSATCDPRRALVAAAAPHFSLDAHAPSCSLHDGQSSSAPDLRAHAGAHRAPCGDCLMEAGAPSPGVGVVGIAWPDTEVDSEEEYPRKQEEPWKRRIRRIDKAKGKG